MIFNFKVKRGKKFFRGPKWNFLTRNKGEFNVRATFSDNCAYRLSKNYDQINKLTGLSFNLLPFYDKESKSWKAGHHKNSARFGWRCVDGVEIEILAYAYIDKERKEKKMLAIEPGDWVQLNFIETDKSYTFKAVGENGESSMVSFRKKDTKKSFIGLFTYRLFPYFGGTMSAPHNMKISLEYLKKFI